jgi:hypothetical protein
LQQAELPVIILRLYCGNPLHQPYISEYAENIRKQYPLHIYIEFDTQTDSKFIDKLIPELKQQDSYILICECPEDPAESLQPIYAILRKLGTLEIKPVLHISGNSEILKGYLAGVSK